MKIANYLPATAVDLFRAKIGQINKRAEKLGVAPLTYRLTGAVKYVEKMEGSLMFAGHRVVKTRELVEVEVSGEQPKLPGGWKLVAVIDHREAEPLVKALPDMMVPAGQRERGPVCDHCNAVRNRAATFVLLAEDGRVVQVGRTCLADFLGSLGERPEDALIWYAEAVGVLSDFEDSEGREGFGSYGREMIDVLDVALISAAMIDEKGWVSKGRAREEDLVATSEDVQFFLFPPRFGAGDSSELYWESLRDALEVRANETLRAEAAAAVEWAKAKDVADGDYLANLGVIARSAKVGADKLGLAVSLVASYRREVARLEERERKAAAVGASQHIGEPKKRLTLEVSLLERPKAFENQFGTSYLHTFVTSEGAVLKWWASNKDLTRGTDLEPGQPFTIKATVKSHGEYQGTPETLVQRVAVQ